MKLLNLFALLCAASLLASGCAEMPANAPIDDRSANRQKGPKPAAQKPQEPEPAADPPGFYTVRKGDTLSRIAQQFNQPWRDVADWNNLSNPNDLKVGQQLRIVPPEGASMASVPMDTGMEVRPLDPAPSAAQRSQPSQASSQPQQPQQPVRSLGGLKTGPLGNKVAYSDQAWGELQRPDAARSIEPQRRAAESPAAGRFVWPAEGKIVRTFDASRKGIDIAGVAGQPVVSAGDGTVLYAKNMRGYGNLVIVDHNDGLVSAYAHNKTILVKEGQTVTRGQRIAEMGDTDADSVKLHFEIRQLGKPVDPAGFLPGR
ncbi:MAG: peptidoglycan DD-metalloendopeptidase family protein [Burkholderiaceae bacterium]|nr:peptidoglycan DD-metalloendopeptidase family protein [Burkholderiaceae bacterium]